MIDIIQETPAGDHHTHTTSTLAGPTVIPHQEKDWYTIEEVAEILHCDPRHARRLIGDPPAGLIKADPSQTSGRPRMLYHWMCHPELRAGHECGANPTKPEQTGKKSVSMDDLAIARFRLQAVKEYQNRKRFEARDVALTETCAAWARRPRRTICKIVQRLPEGYTRIHEKEVVLSDFSPRTLERWDSIYRKYSKHGDDAVLLNLAPGYKEAGREEVEIPPALLYKVHALAVSTARADITKAVELARRQWPGEFPRISMTTWRRRIKSRDAAGVCKTLGKRGIGQFRKDHSPDISRDYSKLSFNGLWQLDDITEDFYGHGFDWGRLVRPKAYAIIRVPTRQWICAVVCEATITQDQVRTLIGFAMASRMGGIPDAIQFERGAVACDEYLENLLSDFGVKVMRTSMDGGKTHRGGIEYNGKGHFQGKGVIESNIRGHHNLNWSAPAQVGPEERHTAHESLEALKTEALRRIDAGETPILPSPEQMQARVFAAFEAHNNRPHSALQETFDMDPITRELKKRHMSPNEYAKTMKGLDAIRVMDERCFPLFGRKCSEVTVTKNGIRLNGFSYGRFNPALQEYQGKQVTVWGLKEFPDYCFVEELGGMVERWENVSFGEEGDLIRQKRSIEKSKRNQFQQLMDQAMHSDGPVTVDSVKFTSNPTPERAVTVCAPDSLLQRALTLRAGVETHKSAIVESDRRFDASKFGDSSEEDAAPAKPETNLRDLIFAMREEKMAMTED